MVFSLVFLMTLSPVIVVGPAGIQEWLEKRADVYISASIEYEEGRSTAVGEVNRGRRISTASPCTRLTMLQLQSGKLPWVLRPYSKASSLSSSNVSSNVAKPLDVSEIRLQGPWQPRMFRSEAECLEHFAAAGEPKTTRKGAVLVIQSGG